MKVKNLGKGVVFEFQFNKKDNLMKEITAFLRKNPGAKITTMIPPKKRGAIAIVVFKKTQKKAVKKLSWYERPIPIGYK